MIEQPILHEKELLKLRWENGKLWKVCLCKTSRVETGGMEVGKQGSGKGQSDELWKMEDLKAIVVRKLKGDKKNGNL